MSRAPILDGPHCVPRTRASASFLNTWSILGYCREGRDHTERGDPCQDSIASGVAADILWLAVADGLGSAHYSHVGSEAAVRLVGSLVGKLSAESEPTAPETGLKIAQSISQSLHEQADSFGIPPKTLATTLQFVLVDINSGAFSYNAIGDGHCVLRSAACSSTILGIGRVQTEFGAPHILMSDWETYFHSEPGVLDDGSLILTFTDGLDPLFLTPRTEQTPHKTVSSPSVDAFNNLFSESYNENKAIFAASQTIDHEKYVDRIRDDVSFLALKWKKQSVGPASPAPKSSEERSLSDEPESDDAQPEASTPATDPTPLPDQSRKELGDTPSSDWNPPPSPPATDERHQKQRLQRQAERRVGFWSRISNRQRKREPSGFVNTMAKTIAVGAFIAVLALLFALSSRMITVQFGTNPTPSNTADANRSELTPSPPIPRERQADFIQPSAATNVAAPEPAPVASSPPPPNSQAIPESPEGNGSIASPSEAQAGAEPEG